jgi:hypothetical protein
VLSAKVRFRDRQTATIALLALAPDVLQAQALEKHTSDDFRQFINWIWYY